MKKQLKSIGIIKTPYNTLSDCPDNISDEGPMCEIIVKKEYEAGLLGLNKNTGIMVLYWLDKYENTKSDLQVLSHADIENLRGVFSLRTPKRPNPIGVAIVNIIKIDENSIFVKGLDCLNDTTLIDIKPAIYQELKEEICEKKPDNK